MSLVIKQYLETIFILVTAIFAIDLAPMIFMFHLDHAMKYGFWRGGFYPMYRQRN